jgi:hypothetical protein
VLTLVERPPVLNHLILSPAEWYVFASWCKNLNSSQEMECKNRDTIDAQSATEGVIFTVYLGVPSAKVGATSPTYSDKIIQCNRRI